MAIIDIGNGFKIIEDFLTPNPYSRPQIKLAKTTKIAIHYTGNPKSTAKNNRDYFNNLAFQKSTNPIYVSSHFIIGLEGEIIQCIPTNEIAYCTGIANSYSISIETCHPDSTGKFNDITEKALIQLVAYLLKQFGLKSPDDIIRHYDVTGKQCPLYYVTNSNAYTNFKNKVTEILNPPVAKKILYRVQIGAFGSKSNAENFLKEVKTKGYTDSFLVEPTTDSFYRVQVGSFSVKTNAENYAKGIESKGMKTIIKEYIS